MDGARRLAHAAAAATGMFASGTMDGEGSIEDIAKEAAASISQSQQHDGEDVVQDRYNVSDKTTNEMRQLGDEIFGLQKDSDNDGGGKPPANSTDAGGNVFAPALSPAPAGTGNNPGTPRGAAPAAQHPQGNGGGTAQGGTHSTRGGAALAAPTGGVSSRPQQTTGSGLEKAIAAKGGVITSEAYLREELSEQADIKGVQTSWETFRDEVTQSRDLLPFVFVAPGGTELDLIHSFAIVTGRGMNNALRNKIVGFVGDRTAHRMPTGVLAPKQGGFWKWSQVAFVNDGAAFQTFYDDCDNAGQIWSPTDRTREVTKLLPRALAVPLMDVVWLNQSRRTAAEYRRRVQDRINQGGHLAEDQWRLVLDWLMAAGQGASPTSSNNTPKSYMEWAWSPALVNEESYFAWQEKVLDGTLGERPSNTPSGGSGFLAPGMETYMATFTDRVVAQVATNQHAAAPASATAPTSAKQEDEYSIEELARLMGYSAVSKATLIPRIWFLFKQKKSIDVHRQNILAFLLAWSKQTGIEVEEGIYFLKVWIEDWMKLRFNPGGILAAYQSAEKGFSPLMSRPWANEELENVRLLEEADDATQGTRTYDEFLRLSRTDPRAPPENYHEFKVMVGTHTGLTWVFFGNDCPLYMQLYTLCMQLRRKEVTMRRAMFKPLLCRQYTWKIIAKGREFFDQIVTPAHFTSGCVSWPTSRLDEMITDVTEVRSSYSVDFPVQWRTERQGLARSGGGALAPAPAPAPTQPRTPRNQQQHGGYGTGGRSQPLPAPAPSPYSSYLPQQQGPGGGAVPQQ